MLWRRKWLIAAAGFLAAFTALVGASLLPKTFSSVGGLIVEDQRLNIPELGIESSPLTSGNEDAVATALDVLRSHGTLESVVHVLDLGNVRDLVPVSHIPVALAGLLRPVEDLVAAFGRASTVIAHGNDGAPAEASPKSAVAADAAMAYLKTHIKVQASDHSDLLTIAFDAGSPDVAASVVNALMTNYIANDVAARRAQLTQANEWLTQRASDLRKQVDADDAQINAFLQNHEIGSLQGGSVAAVQLSDARERLAAALANLSHLQASLDAVTRGSQAGVASAPQVLASPVIQALRQREADLMQRLAGLPPMHPDRQRFEDELRSVRGQIGGETQKIVASLAHEVDVARSNAQQLEDAAEKAAKTARMASVAQAEYTQLLHDADAKRQIYNAFMARADETRLASMQFPAARIQFRATPDSRPVTTKPIIILLFGGFAGAALASAAVLSGYVLRHRINSTGEVLAATGLTVVGSLPEVRLARSRARRLGTHRALQSESLFQETLRAVWLSMRTQAPQATCTTVVVTSSDIGEGKTTVAGALARRVAEDGFSVLLIDADLRRPGFSSPPARTSQSDLEAVLSGAMPLGSAVMTDADSSLHCLMGSGTSSNPVKLLASKEFKDLLTQARRNYDFVVIDSPPVMRVADAVLLSRQCLFTLFVVGYGRVSGTIVAEAISRFPVDSPSRILPVLTRVPARRLDRRDYYGGYGDTMAVPRRGVRSHGLGPVAARLAPHASRSASTGDGNDARYLSDKVE